MSSEKSINSIHPALSSLSPTLMHARAQTSAEVLVARALATLPGFDDWSHRPTSPDIEKLLLDLNEQDLMNTAAVCLLRLMKMREEDPPASTDAA